MEKKFKNAVIVNNDDLVEILSDYFNVPIKNIFRTACSWIIQLEKESRE